MAKTFQSDAPDVRATIVAMTDAGVRRKEIADAAGIDVDTVGRYIDGTRSPNWPRGWAIMRLAEKRRVSA